MPSMPGRRPHLRTDGGFTLIELTVTMVLMGILMTMGVAGWDRYNVAQQDIGTVRDLTGFLRQMGMQAVRDGVPYRIDFAADGHSATAYSCPTSTCTQVGSTAPMATAITYTNPSFTDRNGTVGTSAWFYPRGTASAGSVTITRSGSTVSHTVSIEGLTGRVSYT